MSFSRHRIGAMVKASVAVARGAFPGPVPEPEPEPGLWAGKKSAAHAGRTFTLRIGRNQSVITSSTRRFCWRPAAVLFVATGSDSPFPLLVM